MIRHVYYLNLFFTYLLLGIVALVIVIGFVAIFQNNQQENDELRQIGIRCEQQLGAMESTKARMQNMIDAEQLEKEGCREKMKNVEDKMRENSKSLESAKQSKSITETHLGDCKNEKDQLSSDNKKLKEEIKSLKLEKTRKIEALEVSFYNIYVLVLQVIYVPISE